MGIKEGLRFKHIFTIGYFLAFFCYLIIGFNLTDAASSYDSVLKIDSINLTTPVTKLTLEDHELNTPDYIAGSFSSEDNKTLIIGHSTSVFNNLKDVKEDEIIWFGANKYKIISVKTVKKESINMKKLLRSEKEETLILMTCAGKLFNNGDATERLLVTAVALN